MSAITTKDRVVIECYGAESAWESRSEAVAFYSEGALACEGSEADRYLNIVTGLMMGLSYVTDSMEYIDLPLREGEYVL